jgi:D-lactate dehydrogenase
MKDGVILINCSRGELMDIESLVEGIESQKIGALGMDTAEGDEDIIHQDHRVDILTNRNWFYLHQFRNVIMTQHMAFYTDAAVDSMVECGIRGIWAMAHGEPCETELTTPASGKSKETICA